MTPKRFRSTKKGKKKSKDEGGSASRNRIDSRVLLSSSQFASADAFDDRASSRFKSVERTPKNSKVSLRLLGFSMDDVNDSAGKFKPKLKSKYKPK